MAREDDEEEHFPAYNGVQARPQSPSLLDDLPPEMRLPPASVVRVEALALAQQLALAVKKKDEKKEEEKEPLQAGPPDRSYPTFDLEEEDEDEIRVETIVRKDKSRRARPEVAVVKNEEESAAARNPPVSGGSANGNRGSSSSAAVPFAVPSSSAAAYGSRRRSPPEDVVAIGNPNPLENLSAMRDSVPEIVEIAEPAAGQPADPAGISSSARSVPEAAASATPTAGVGVGTSASSGSNGMTNGNGGQGQDQTVPPPPPPNRPPPTPMDENPDEEEVEILDIKHSPNVIVKIPVQQILENGVINFSIHGKKKDGGGKGPEETPVGEPMPSTSKAAYSPNSKDQEASKNKKDRISSRRSSSSSNGSNESRKRHRHRSKSKSKHEPKKKSSKSKRSQSRERSKQRSLFEDSDSASSSSGSSSRRRSRSPLRRSRRASSSSESERDYVNYYPYNRPPRFQTEEELLQVILNCGLCIHRSSNRDDATKHAKESHKGKFCPVCYAVLPRAGSAWKDHILHEHPCGHTPKELGEEKVECPFPNCGTKCEINGDGLYRHIGKKHLKHLEQEEDPGFRADNGRKKDRTRRKSGNPGRSEKRPERSTNHNHAQSSSASAATRAREEESVRSREREPVPPAAVPGPSRLAGPSRYPHSESSRNREREPERSQVNMTSRSTATSASFQRVDSGHSQRQQKEKENLTPPHQRHVLVQRNPAATATNPANSHSQSPRRPNPNVASNQIPATPTRAQVQAHQGRANNSSNTHDQRHRPAGYSYGQVSASSKPSASSSSSYANNHRTSSSASMPIPAVPRRAYQNPAARIPSDAQSPRRIGNSSDRDPGQGQQRSNADSDRRKADNLNRNGASANGVVPNGNGHRPSSSSVSNNLGRDPSSAALGNFRIPRLDGPSSDPRARK